jgi:hypothetical protein
MNRFRGQTAQALYHVGLDKYAPPVAENVDLLALRHFVTPFHRLVRP